MKIIFQYTDVCDLLDSLDEVAFAKVTRLLDAVSQDGVMLGMPLSRSLGHGLHELRIMCKQNVRVFYTKHKGNIVVLHAIIKKSQKLPRYDLERARNRLRLLRAS
jgi:phage-related protein